MAARARFFLRRVIAASMGPLGSASAVAQSADPGFEPSGQELYETICQACHMEGGMGAAGAYPALAGNPKLASPRYPLSLVVDGRGNMPPFGAQLTDRQIAAVVSYIRTHFGNAFADPVTPTDVKAARHQTPRGGTRARDSDDSGQEAFP
jgi:mono/diheme cytochrome c family protein